MGKYIDKMTNKLKTLTDCFLSIVFCKAINHTKNVCTVESGQEAVNTLPHMKLVINGCYCNECFQESSNRSLQGTFLLRDEKQI